MANLIPQDAKKIVVREYWLRVASVWMFLLTVAGLIIGALMVPTYILIDSQHQALANRFSDARSQHDAFASATESITRANTLARYLDRSNNTITFIDLKKMVEASAGQAVTVQQYTFSQEPNKPSPLTISGVASNRTELIAFKDALLTQAVFSDVELPLSNLAGDQNVSFSMTLTVKGDE